MTPRALMCVTVFAATVLLPASAPAQDNELSGIGIGPRVTFVRGGADSTESQRFSGGSLRIRGEHVGLDIAMDYRSGVTGSLTERFKEYPIQGSLLLYPVRARFSPYILGGLGWYTQTVTTTNPTTTLPEAETSRTMGYHAGFGAEVRVHRRVGLYGDYRYTQLRMGEPEEGTGSGSDATPRLIPFAERLRLSHKGSMFAWGAAFYF